MICQTAIARRGKYFRGIDQSLGIELDILRLPFDN
jgi:hypothetical protein